MNQLEACPHCERHVKVDESACPFCKHSLAVAFAHLPRRVAPRARLGRAATFAFGLGVTMTQGACVDRPDPRQDAASIPVDATPDAGTPVDADFDYDGGFPIYSAAPVDGRRPGGTTG